MAEVRNLVFHSISALKTVLNDSMTASEALSMCDSSSSAVQLTILTSGPKPHGTMSLKPRTD